MPHPSPSRGPSLGHELLHLLWLLTVMNGAHSQNGCTPCLLYPSSLFLTTSVKTAVRAHEAWL